MRVKLQPLQLSDAENLYEFFQKLPASENGKNNRAHGLSHEDFTKWVQHEIDSAHGKNIKPGRVPGTTFVLYIDDTPVGVSNLRHYLNENLQQDGGHIGTHILPEYRGRGYGNIITLETLKKAKETGINPVLIFNRDDNVPAWRTSEKLGGKLDSINIINGTKLRKYLIDTSKI